MKTPRKPKDLLALLMSSTATLNRFYAAVREADTLLEKRMSEALAAFLRENDIDLSYMNHADVTTALNAFYRKARLAGRFVRLW